MRRVDERRHLRHKQRSERPDTPKRQLVAVVLKVEPSAALVEASQAAGSEMLKCRDTGRASGSGKRVQMLEAATDEKTDGKSSR